MSQIPEEEGRQSVADGGFDLQSEGGESQLQQQQQLLLNEQQQQQPKQQPSKPDRLWGRGITSFVHSHILSIVVFNIYKAKLQHLIFQ